MGATRYARCGDLHLAYQVVGEGPLDLLVVPPFISHLEMWWPVPQTAAWVSGLARFSRVILFDKAGTGLSDPVASVATLEDRAGEIDAVLEAVGAERVVLLGLSEGGPACLLYSANHPHRVSNLILYGSYATMLAGAATGKDILEPEPGELHDSLHEELGDRYCPSLEQIERMRRFYGSVRDSWGDGAALLEMAPSAAGMRSQLGLVERVSASPGMALASLTSAMRIDVRPILPSITVPTLLLHATGDLIPVQCARYLSDHLPDARLVELKGDDHPPWFSNAERGLELIERFVTGGHTAEPSQRVLTTVLFTDIVGSTQQASELGDERWRFVLERCEVVTQEEVAEHGGRVVKSLGDGHFATFPGPARAIRCAEAILARLEEVGVALRAGVHTGECEVLGDDLGGMGVHIGARIGALAAAREVLVSSTVRDLVVGSGLAFVERGQHTLKGVPGTWTLLAVAPPEGTPEAALAGTPTPSTAAYLTRGDRLTLRLARAMPRAVRRLAAIEQRRLGLDLGRIDVGE